MSSPRDQFGKPREGGKYETITVPDEGSIIGRPLPPYGSNRDTGQWCLFCKNHYGAGIKDSKDGDKIRARPYECVEEKEQSGLITTSCPACEDMKLMRQAQADAVALKTKLMTEAGEEPEDIKTAIKDLNSNYNKWFKDHNLDMKWLIPWKTQDGRFVLLKIPHKGKKAIEKVRKEFKAKKKPIDLLDIDNGFWIEVSRTGKLLATEYDAKAVKDTKNIDGAEYEVLRAAPLSDEDLDTILKVLPDLNGSNLIRKLSPQQIQLIIDSKYAPETVETVLNMSVKTKTANPAPVDEMDEVEYEEPTSTQSVAVAPQPAPTAPTEPELSDEDRELAEMEAKAATLRAKKAAKAAAPAPVSQAASKPSAAPKVNPLDSSMSDDEFVARFGPRSNAQTPR